MLLAEDASLLIHIHDFVEVKIFLTFSFFLFYVWVASYTHTMLCKLQIEQAVGDVREAFGEGYRRLNHVLLRHEHVVQVEELVRELHVIVALAVKVRDDALLEKIKDAVDNVAVASIL